jgi:hypothetical protein
MSCVEAQCRSTTLLIIDEENKRKFVKTHTATGRM